ncbi:MAG: Nif3-like dinuclear metal center hexameric protein [Desulfobacterales bacterium]|nr:Nif3-like dinuclear metal center hexameric protein [Desulfobacterales bacterium]
MKASIGQIFELVDGIAPFQLAESWDNCGLQVGSLEDPVKRVLVALDVSEAAMAEAVAQKADLLLTHHPLYITPPKQIDFNTMIGGVIAEAARHKISVISAHTNLDKAKDGLNDHFAGYLDLENLRPFVPEKALDSNGTDTGIGRLGTPKDKITVQEMAEQLKAKLNLPQIRVIGDLEKEVSLAAVCTGSGGSLIQPFLETPAQVYVTGDIKYHEAREIEIHDRALIDVGHFASEIIAVEFLTRKLEQAVTESGFDVSVIGFKKEMDPFVLV